MMAVQGRRSGSGVPLIPLKPPKGFRFEYDQLIHLDNEVPLANARAGETFDFLDIESNQILGTGTVLGIMCSSDSRARADQHVPRHLGVYFVTDLTQVRAWRAQGWFRQPDGRLTFTLV